MTYADIVNALPPSVMAILQRHLDSIQMPQAASYDSILTLLKSAVDATKAELESPDQRDVLLLSMVPAAAAEMLFY